VQISASKTMLEPKSFNFKGLSPIKRIKSGSLYKYFLGNTTSYEKAKELQQRAIEKGYSGSFVVAFQREVIVPLNNALKRN
jgi:N-acetylmuramoyl-L-alanine amidase